MATQDDRSRTIASGTVDGLLEFCDYLVEKGYGTSAAITPWKSASRQVFGAVEGEDFGSRDVRSIDLDEYLARFENMERGNYKAESIQAYGTRVRRAVDAYLAFLADGRAPQLKRGVRRQRDGSRGNATLAGARSEGSATATAPGIADLIEYPFPLASGQMAYLRLPRRLEKPDAERIAAYVQTLVYEPQLAKERGAEEA
jgi:hypothetical protein